MTKRTANIKVIDADHDSINRYLSTDPRQFANSVFVIGSVKMFFDLKYEWIDHKRELIMVWNALLIGGRMHNFNHEGFAPIDGVEILWTPEPAQLDLVHPAWSSTTTRANPARGNSNPPVVTSISAGAKPQIESWGRKIIEAQHLAMWEDDNGRAWIDLI